MESPFSTSCEWATAEIPHRFPATASFSPRQNLINNEDAFGSGRDEFCMNTVSALAISSSVQPTPTSLEGIYGDFRTNYECSTEDLGLLNIPSIQETLGSSFDLSDHDADDHDESANELESAGDGSGDGLTSRDETVANTCGNDHTKDPSEVAPKAPVKRLRRQRANDRERRRMKSLNGALNNLKRCIPLPKTKRRVTKLEILRIACHYIQTLWETLHNENNEGQSREIVARSRNTKRNHAVNGMTVTQRLSLLSSNLKFNFQL